MGGGMNVTLMILTQQVGQLLTVTKPSLIGVWQIMYYVWQEVPNALQEATEMSNMLTTVDTLDFCTQ